MAMYPLPRFGAIQRGLLALESQGGAQIFGEPMLNIADLIQTDRGRGVINILSADRLMQSPKMYATLLLWLLAELFENLPEAGDLAKPKLVFFFDEAHLLFKDAPQALVDKIELVVRLIRSKGVGVYFVTQNPADIPESISGQLGNRVQHALLVEQLKGTTAKTASGTTGHAKGKTAQLLSLEERLRQKLGTHVSIRHGRKKGRLEIEYYGNDDLQSLLGILGVTET